MSCGKPWWILQTGSVCKETNPPVTTKPTDWRPSVLIICRNVFYMLGNTSSFRQHIQRQVSISIANALVPISLHWFLCILVINVYGYAICFKKTPHIRSMQTTVGDLVYIQRHNICHHFVCAISQDQPHLNANLWHRIITIYTFKTNY